MKTYNLISFKIWRGMIVLLILVCGAVYSLTHGFTQNEIVAGVLRNNGSGWAILNDANHKPLGLEGIRCEGRFLEISFDFEASEIHSLIVVPDETLAGLGVIVGASVQKDKAVIMASINGEYINLEHFESKWGNFWVYGLFTVN